MTYNVWSGTLNSIIPYHSKCITVRQLKCLDMIAGFPLTWKVRERQGIEEIWEKSGNFVGGQRKIACIIRLSNSLTHSLLRLTS